MNLDNLHILEFYGRKEKPQGLDFKHFSNFCTVPGWLQVCIFRLGIKNAGKEHVNSLKGQQRPKFHTFEETRHYGALLHASAARSGSQGP